MHHPILADIVIIFTLGAAVLLLFARLKIPPIIGFLVTGVLAGPGVLGAITAVAEVEVLAEIGVILLMFTIGLEFSVSDFLRMRKAVLGGGAMQVGFSILATLLVFLALGLPLNIGVFAGFLVALSSTAIVLRLLQARAEIESPHGRVSLGILIFQDIIIVPMMLLTPILAGATEGSIGMELLLLLAKSIGAIAAVFAVARFLIPRVLQQVVGTRNQELFLLFTVMLCFLVAWLMASIGLSLALGAFLAGMILADSEYAHHALGNVLPLRNLFTSFFFVSVGMLLSPGAVFEQPWTVLLLTIAAIAGKSLLAAGAVRLLRYPTRTALLAGFGLGQIGEFSFILSRVGVDSGLLTDDMYQLFLSVSILSMALTPVLMVIAPRVAAWLGAGRQEPEHREDEAREGLLIVGYGLNGRNLYQAAHEAGIRVSIIEMNPDTVRIEREKGVPIGFGDATQDAVLLHAGVRAARVVVIAISDPAATGRITERVRDLNPDTHIIARTRFTSEIPRLQDLGADEVIPEEFETAIRIFVRTASSLGLPVEATEAQVQHLRDSGYAALCREPDAQG